MKTTTSARSLRQRRRASEPPRFDEDGSPATLAFLRLIWALAHALQVRSKYMSRTLRVTGPQRLALRLIESAPGLTASELTATLHVHKSTLSGVLQRLEARGLIARETDGDDARRQRLSVTDTGRELIGKRAGSVESTASEVLREFTPREVEATCRLLQRLADRLGHPPRTASAP